MTIRFDWKGGIRKVMATMALSVVARPLTLYFAGRGLSGITSRKVIASNSKKAIVTHEFGFLLLCVEVDVDIDEMSTRQTDQLNLVSSDYGISSGKFCRY